MIVAIRYVDGSEVEITPEDWAAARSDGVDYFEIGFEEFTERVQGHSIYWLYKEYSGWVAGGADSGRVAYEAHKKGQKPLEEVIAGADGFDYRTPKYMPDLKHSQVKLGWWMPEGDS